MRKSPISDKNDECLITNETSDQTCRSFRFRREEHLKGRKEIREVFKNGMQFSYYKTSGSGVKLFVLKNELSLNRICFTFSKGFKGAVSRNRAKRLGREAYRLIKHRLENGYDFILLFYPEQKKTLSKKNVVCESSVTRSSVYQPSIEKPRVKEPLASKPLVRIQLESLFKKAGLFK
jgi:ribonuclease P protein component